MKDRAEKGPLNRHGDLMGTFCVVILIFWAIFKHIAGLEHVVVSANANRRKFLVFAASFLLLAVKLLHTHSHNPHEWGEILAAPISGQPMTLAATGALFCIMIAFMVAALVAKCCLTMATDPSNFKKPGDTQNAAHYYIYYRVPGYVRSFFQNDNGDGLDYCIVVEHRKGQDKPRQLGEVVFYPGLATKNAELDIPEPIKDQVQNWRAEAMTMYGAVQKEGKYRKIASERLGPGGNFFAFIRTPDSPVGTKFVFAVTTENDQLANGTAQEDFDLIVAALRNIEKSIVA